jgi:hypothetical protein
LRDRRGRTMPASVDRRDGAVAKIVLQLFREGESRDDVTRSEFEVPLPRDAHPSDDPSQWMTYVRAMPDIAGRPTLRILVAVEGATPLRMSPRPTTGSASSCAATTARRPSSCASTTSASRHRLLHVTDGTAARLLRLRA